MLKKSSAVVLTGLLIAAASLGSIYVFSSGAEAERIAVDKDSPEAFKEFMGINNDPLMGNEMSAEQILKAFVPDMPGEYEYEDDFGKTHIYDEGYVLENRSDEVWVAAALQFMEKFELPDGTYFPNTAPMFFKPGEMSLLETGAWEDHALSYDLYRQFVTKYWACAWIETQSEAVELDDSVLYRLAQSNISQYETAPGTEAKYQTYQEFKETLMEQAGGDEFLYNQLWFDIECKTYEMEKVKK